MTARYCKCGHNVLSHYAVANKHLGGLRLQTGMRKVDPSDQEWTYDKFHCHGDRCACRWFTEDRSLWHQFRRWVQRHR